MAKMGRPEHDFDWKMFDRYCALHAELDFICRCLLEDQGKPINQRSVETMRRFIERRTKRLHGVTFVEYREQKRLKLRSALLNKQYEVALKGNCTMLIWLGKNELGQTDKVEQQTMVSGPVEGNGAPVQVVFQTVAPKSGEPKERYE